MSPGADLGPLRPDVAEFVGADLSLVAVGSHDTASAVVAVPMSGEDAAYISCGTWGLVGVELETPIASVASRIANFTNEAGVDGRTRFLTNVMGTWILSEAMRTWEGEGDLTSIDQVLAEAAALDRPVPLFDVQDPRFLAPGDMPARIEAWCEEHGLPPPRGRAAIVRSIIESLSAGFARAVDQVAELAGRTIRRVHVVGGGSLNRPAVPGDRGSLRTRGDRRVPWRRRPWATCSSRVERSARSRGAWSRCVISSLGRTTW